MNAVRARKEDAQSILQALFIMNVVDKRYRVADGGKWVYIPLLRALGSGKRKKISSMGGKLVDKDVFTHRNRAPPPLDAIKSALKSVLSNGKLEMLPDKWELVGGVLVFKLHPRLVSDKKKIAAVYAGCLGARAVLLDTGGIKGAYRIPAVRFLYGKDAVTIHRENKIKFRLDVSKLMFASGNKEERKRMANISGRRETVVDMFAGIGYFSIPMAVYSRPEKIYSCELNPTAYHYLNENITLNHVENVIEPLLGDCRETAPEGVADRVVMGYFGSCEFLPKALKVLKEGGGIIHYHEACPNELFGRPEKRIKAAAARQKKKVKILRFGVVKSYAPCVSHVVVDARIS